jgi:hypothetical protein
MVHFDKKNTIKSMNNLSTKFAYMLLTSIPMKADIHV